MDEEQSNSCEERITEDDLLDALKSMKENKSPGNDGLTKEFYETFWYDIKASFLSSIEHFFQKGELSSSQKQAVIKLLEKMEKLNQKKYLVGIK